MHDYLPSLISHLCLHGVECGYMHLGLRNSVLTPSAHAEFVGENLKPHLQKDVGQKIRAGCAAVCLLPAAHICEQLRGLSSCSLFMEGATPPKIQWLVVCLQPLPPLWHSSSPWAKRCRVAKVLLLFIPSY